LLNNTKKWGLRKICYEYREDSWESYTSEIFQLLKSYYIYTGEPLKILKDDSGRGD